jgi:hypothetical protein
MMKDENTMITSLSGGAFEIRTGRPWTFGFSPARDRDFFSLEWVANENGIGGRWFFEVHGVQYSASQISPHIKGIQMHTEGY